MTKLLANAKIAVGKSIALPENHQALSIDKYEFPAATSPTIRTPLAIAAPSWLTTLE